MSILALIGMMMMASCGKKGSKTTAEIPADFRDAKMTKSGILYKFISHNTDTSKAFRFDRAMDFEIIVKNQGDSLMSNQGKPGAQLVEHYIYRAPTFKGDPNEIFGMFAEGDSVIFAIPADSLAKAQGRPNPAYAQGSYIKHYMKVIRVKPAEEAKLALAKMRKIQDSLMQRRRDSLMQVQIQINKDDSIAIRKYVKEKNLADKAKFTESGLCYIITEEGDGRKPEKFDSVATNYVGRLMNGKLFDTNSEEIAKKEGKYTPQRTYGPFQFMIGVGKVIRAWDEGLMQLKKGGKAILIAPSKLAYGPRALGKDVPANSIMVFDVELTDVKKGSIPKTKPQPIPKGHSKGDGHNH